MVCLIVSSVAAEGGPTTAEGGAGPTDSGVAADVPIVTLSPVLLNEISATKEWVELVSTGATATDVSGYRVADSEKEGGAPKLSDAVTFPAGTVPPVEETTFRTAADMEPFLREPLSEGWKTIFALPWIGQH